MRQSYFLACLGLCCGTAWAQDSLKATITGVEGIVQVRSDDKSPWQKAAAGMEVGEGAEFRTGPRSAVRFTLPPEQTITLDRLGTVKLLEVIRNEKLVKTGLGMQYGRVRYDIEASGQEHASTIRTPGAALAVRGTQVSIYDQPPFKPQATSLTGAAQFRNARKQMLAFGAKGRKTEVAADANSAAETAENKSILSSFEVQRSEQQARELAFLTRNQGLVFGNVASSNVPVTDAELPSLFTGRLNFALRWSEPAGQSADLNLIISDTQGRTFGNPPFLFSLFPNAPEVKDFLAKNFPLTHPLGGEVGLNHIGPEGVEIGTFGANVPRGAYVVGAYNFLYLPQLPPDPSLPRVPFKLEVFLDGKRQPLVTNLQDVMNNQASPIFKKVYQDEIAIGELAVTAVNIRDVNQNRGKRDKRQRPVELTPPKEIRKNQGGRRN